MRLLITGAAGFVGARLVVAASAAGHDVVCVTRRQPETSPTISDTARVYEACDLSDRAAVSALVQRVRPDAVLHAAARIPTRGGEDAFHFFDDNVRASLHVLDAASHHGVSQVVLSSSMAVYGDPSYLPVDEAHPTVPTGAYGLSKLEAELYGRLYARPGGLRVSVLRYSGVFGLGQRTGAIPTFIGRCRRNEPLSLHAGGRPTSDYVWAEDVARANLLALAGSADPPFRVYNVGGGQESSVAALAALVRRVTDSSSEIVLDNTPSFRDFRFAYDIRKADAELGYVPTPFAEAIATHVQALPRT